MMQGINSSKYKTFHGDWLHRRQVHGFVLSETSCAPGLKINRHSHERPGFCVVLQGGFVEYRLGSERLYRIADIIFRPSGELHANQFLPAGGRCLNIEIASEPLQRLGAKARAFSEPADFRNQRLSELTMRIHRELAQTDALTSLALESLALELLIETARGAEPACQKPRWLARATELLHERFNEPLSLQEIAEAVGVHRAHLARTFRRFQRQTIGDYLRQLRLEFARTRLADANEPISTIALAAGFYDQCHFSRVFKRHTGMSPAEYRNVFGPGHSRARLQN